MRNVQFQEKAYQEFIEWSENDKDMFLKIDRLIRDISRNPFKGLGKPEPLKHQYKGFYPFLNYLYPKLAFPTSFRIKSSK